MANPEPLKGGRRGRPPWPASPPPTSDEVYGNLAEQAREYPKFLESLVHPDKAFNKPEALDRIRVLDCSTGMAIGHWASSMLAELGAEVIQVEPPGGDPLRQLTPFGRKEYMLKDAQRGEPVGLHFLHEMRNKLAITLNLEKKEGRDVLKKLATQVDVVIENASPGQWDKWRIGYRQLSKLNPRLVYCWVGQRGQWGPLKDKPGMRDPVAQCASGFVHGTGDPKEFGGRPTRSGMWVADHVGGTAAAMGIVAALIHRERTSGKGQFIEATAAEGIIRILDYDWVWHGMDGSIRPRYGNWDLAINIYAVNPCKDGYMMVGGGHDRLWYRIWKTVGDEVPQAEEEIIADTNLRNISERLPHTRQVKTYTLLCEWLKDNTRAEAERKLVRQEVASGGVMAIHEVAEYPHFKYRKQVAEFDDQLYGKVLVASSPNLAEKVPARLKWVGRPVGYDNDEVYRRLLGFTRGDFDRLGRQGVI
ncbi:MAG: CoA transferase [Candidatus Rokubacteria bacterium]|nr:CoA transferase [Candidatus Rokubacteria bacterium]